MSLDPGDNSAKWFIFLIARRGASGLTYRWDGSWKWMKPFDALSYSTDLEERTPESDVISYVWNGKTTERAFVGSSSHIGFDQKGTPNMAHVRAHPQGTCFKTCIYREGNYLHAVTTMVKDGDCEVFKASVDLRPIARAIQRYHAKLHGTTVSGNALSVGGSPSELAQLVANVINTQYASQPIVKGSRAQVDAAFANLNSHLSQIGESDADRHVLAQQIADALNLVLDMQGHKNDAPFSYYRAYIDTAFRDNILPAISALPKGGSSFLSKLAHTKVMKAIGHQINVAVHSKVLGGIVAATAVVFPPVGLPAAAAYATANAALMAIDRGNKVASKVTQIATSGSDAAKAAAHSVIPEIQQAMKDKADAHSWFGKLAAEANAKKQQALQLEKMGQRLAAKLMHAQAMLPGQIVNIVAAQKAALEARMGGAVPPAGSIPALLIGDDGRIMKGHYLLQAAKSNIRKATLYHGGKVLNDTFAKVGASRGGMVSNPMQLPSWAR